MTPYDTSAELLQLLGRLADGQLSGRDHDKLLEILRENGDARAFYLDYMEVHALLEWKNIGDRRSAIDVIPDLEARGCGDYEVSAPPALFPLPSPLSSSFVGGPVFSYMVASVVLCLMLLGAWAHKISHVISVSSPTADKTRTIIPPPVFAGRITGMKDCRWADPDTRTYLGASAPLGREYVLASGLMEIKYRSGAKVILEGPCSYKVESSAGGFLAKGKLTAKIRTQSSKPTTQSPEPSPLSSLPSPLFSVRTPTAVVTDLGTEFGVEVAENGDTTSYVFQGSVKVEILPSPVGGRGAGGEGGMVQLAAGESVLVKKTAAEMVRFTRTAISPKFVRRIYEPPKLLDLLDVVAGGDGTGRQREHGIDPATGAQDPLFVSRSRDGLGQYMPVAWHKLIDGVFVPDGGEGAVRLDSAGNTFDAFPNTTGRTSGSIWSRAAKPVSDQRAKDMWNWVYFMGRGERFMPNRRGLLGFHANAGVTFDLAAVRRSLSDARPTRFLATAGMADASNTGAGAGMADFWVFVDGTLKFKRENIRPDDGALDVVVELGPNDRFLTLAATDGGDGITCDWLVVGEPRLELKSKDEEKK